MQGLDLSRNGGHRSVRAAVGGLRVRPAWLAPPALGIYLYLQLLPTSDGHGATYWLAVLVVAAAALLVVRRIGPLELLAAEVLAAALVTDWEFSGSGGLRDLGLYLRAGRAFLAGGPIYTTAPISHYPPFEVELPFLYAPPTLPLFGALSAIPYPLAAAIWVGGSALALIACLRAFGLPWRWVALALLWPPIEQGLFTGNVVVPSLILLALPGGLAGGILLGPLLKPQNAILALWLVREHAWRRLAGGLLAFVALVAVTLPLTGAGRWTEWLTGLAAYGQSQQGVPGLYGIGLGRYAPIWLVALLAAAVTLLALVPRGRDGLNRLAVASLVASPSLWNHGFAFAIPSFLRLRAAWFWLAAGLLCAGRFPGPHLALAIAVSSWLVPAMVRPSAAGSAAGSPDILHPLAGTGGPDRPERLGRAGRSVGGAGISPPVDGVGAGATSAPSMAGGSPGGRSSRER